LDELDDVLSVAFIVKLYVPDALGVPLITPLEVFSAKPAGSDPLAANVIGGVPPDVCTVWLYVFVMTGAGSDAVTMESAPAVTVTVLLSVMPLPPAESCISKMNVYVPGVVGVPLNVHVEPAAVDVVGLTDNPGGSAPLSSVQ
jgi:hypothetical protein